MIRVYVTNLAKYNEGLLRGKWLDLPLSEEELVEEINEILGNDEEYFITDYEGPVRVEEYDNIEKLNDMAEKLEISGEEEENIEILAKVIDTKEELVEILENGDYIIVPNVYTYKELAESALYGEVTESLLPFNIEDVRNAGAESYIDWESVGRELDIDGWFIEGGKAVKVIE